MTSKQTEALKPWQDIADAAGILRAHNHMWLADRLLRHAEALSEEFSGTEQPAQQQEPVAIVAVDGLGQIQVGWLRKPQHNDKLYTSPPAQRKPLTDEQQIAEALRVQGLTLVKTASGYEVLKLGQITAHGITGEQK